MWLLDTRAKKLEHFVDVSCSPYAILSHTWTQDERSFKDVHDLGRSSDKIDAVCAQSVKDGHSHVWVDTCCIDKSSSAEMSEAINSMYRFYKNAATCYVYLEDYDIDKRSVGQFEGCRWFTRGWTLQELIAPRELIFLDVAWRRIGTKNELLPHLHQGITGVDPLVLYRPVAMRRYSVAKRMSWAAGRQTTRPEDRAYSLMGIFEVNMPLLYGEGNNAFVRLQEEIMKRSTDMSILAWRQSSPTLGGSLLATSPDGFEDCAFVQRVKHTSEDDESFEMTNSGLKINLPIFEDGLKLWASLDCAFMPAPGREYPWPVLRSSTNTDGSRMMLALRIEPANTLYNDATRIFHVNGQDRLALHTYSADRASALASRRQILLRRHSLDPDMIRGPGYELHLNGILFNPPFQILNSYPSGRWDLEHGVLSYDGTEYTYACVEIFNALEDVRFVLGVVVHPRLGDLAQETRAKSSTARLSVTMEKHRRHSLTRIMADMQSADGSDVVCDLSDGRAVLFGVRESVGGPLTIRSEVVAGGEEKGARGARMEVPHVRRLFRTKPPT